MSASETLLHLEDVSKEFPQGGARASVLHSVTLSIPRGEVVSIVGPSGAGKSTLLQLMGGLDRPTSGRVALEGKDLGSLDEVELASTRRRRIGFVFQFFNLIAALRVWHNLALPLLLDGVSQDRARQRAEELAGRLGIVDKVDRDVSTLSGGEMQRVAIGRALAARPSLILADEPTGSLDTRTGETVLELLAEMVDEEDGTLVLVTHDPRVASLGQRRIELVDGSVRLLSDA